jgi:hypothetical protein
MKRPDQMYATAKVEAVQKLELKYDILFAT